MTQQISHPLSFVVADASSAAGPVGSLFNDFFHVPREKIERKVTNFVAKTTKSAGMTRLQLADNGPFKSDVAIFPHWCADGSGLEIAHHRDFTLLSWFEMQTSTLAQGLDLRWLHFAGVCLCAC